jgi:hypothetical protein
MRPVDPQVLTIPPSLLTKRLIQERPLYERQGPPVSLLCPTFRHIAAEVCRAGSAPRINELPRARRGRATRDDAGRALPPPCRTSARVPVPPGFVPAAPLPSSLTRSFDRLLAVKIPGKPKSCSITLPGARAPRTRPRRALTATAHHSSQRPIAPSVLAASLRMTWAAKPPAHPTHRACGNCACASLVYYDLHKSLQMPRPGLWCPDR